MHILYHTVIYLSPLSLGAISSFASIFTWLDELKWAIAAYQRCNSRFRLFSRNFNQVLSIFDSRTTNVTNKVTYFAHCVYLTGPYHDSLTRALAKKTSCRSSVAMSDCLPIPRHAHLKHGHNAHTAEHSSKLIRSTVKVLETRRLRTAIACRPSKLELLPTEIWLLLKPYLILSEQALLALTCQRANSIFDRSLLKLRQPQECEERVKLLFYISTWFPDQYLCGDCIIFHHNKTSYEAYRPRDVLLCLGRAAGSPKRPRRVVITYEDAKALKNNACSGVLSVLSFDDGHVIGEKIRYEASAGVTWTSHVVSLLRNGRLIVTIWSMLPWTPLFQQQQQQQQRPIISTLPTYCHHELGSSTLMSHVEAFVRRASQPLGKVEEEHLFCHDSPLYRCPYCNNEYVVRLCVSSETLSTEAAKYGVMLIRYMDLGQCQSPHDSEWAHITRRRPQGITANVPYDLGTLESVAKRYFGPFHSPWAVPGGPVLSLID